jgi:hypothetical protein
MTRIIEQERIDRMRLKCKTDSDRIVAYLWSIYPDYAPTHELRGRETPFGWIGSAGDVRVRELARNDCAAHLQGRVESKPGREIGKDPRYEWFRYKLTSAPKPTQKTMSL